MQAGELRQLVGFFKRLEIDDGAGNVLGGFGLVPEFTAAAAIVPRLGGEAILAGRLEGKNAVNITVRYSPQSAQVTHLATLWVVLSGSLNLDHRIGALTRLP